MLAAEVVSQEMGPWVVGVVLAAIISVLGFLVRNAFDGIARSIESLGSKLDGLKADLAKGDGDRRVLEARVNSLELRVAELAREVREASEGVAR